MHLKAGAKKYEEFNSKTKKEKDYIDIKFA